MRELLGLLLTHAVLTGVGIVFLGASGLAGQGTRACLVALGPGFLIGVCLVSMTLIVLLVVGVPFTLWTAIAVSAVWLAAGWLTIRRREARHGSSHRVTSGGLVPSGLALVARRVALAVLAAYAAFGAYAQVRLPPASDDVRIWSLKGLTLTYYSSLRPEIFANSSMTRAHPIYPLLQPVFEGLLFRAMGHPQLSWFHTELWLVAGATIWTAAYLVSRTRAGSWAMLAWLPVLVLIAIAPESLQNIQLGLADVTGSTLLGAGSVALGLWFQRGEGSYLAVASVLIAGAANTKDEDLIGAAAVLIVAAVALLVRRRPGQLRGFAAAVAVVIAFVGPWRIWVSAHHLTDSVSPPIPRGLSPIYILDRLNELHLSLTAMISTALSGFPWLAPTFLAVCIVCLASGHARRTAAFYLGSFILIAVMLLWLYTTTPLSLGFLLPTSMNRTVSVFMMLAGFAAAHLISELATGPDPPVEPPDLSVETPPG